MTNTGSDLTPPPEPTILFPIGYVENSFNGPGKFQQGHPVTSRIILNPSLADGLIGLRAGDEILVVFWFHKSTRHELLQHPQGDTSRAKRGVFTLRSPHRPNPIGITQVRIMALQRNVLSVTDLDAFDGTPVLDLKPVSKRALLAETPPKR